ncbi:hypothetical protein [Ahrensia sp. R2A130]|nr:hypothetical protein [Ahrensia sp. R2A130]EFL89001.1 hypothetical protein R2A130_1488 [Ahrensia sp. R2A130]
MKLSTLFVAAIVGLMIGLSGPNASADDPQSSGDPYTMVAATN